jgi:hypothetical protein
MRDCSITPWRDPLDFLPVEPPPERPATSVPVHSDEGQGDLFQNAIERVAEAEALREPEEDAVDDE